jgi:subtilisin-like proprotein convertase family protein
LERLEDRHLLAVGPWYELTELSATSDFQPGDGGGGVAVSADTVVIGARKADNTINGTTTTNSGKVYIYGRNDAGTLSDLGDNSWFIKQELVPEDLSDGDYFGHAVAMDGDTLVVGAFHPTDICCPNTELGDGYGVAYVYRRNVTTDFWELEQKLTPDSYGGLNDRFGWSVDIEGDIIAVGARSYDDVANGLVDQGAVYVFRFDGSGWLQEPQPLVGSADGDNFGYDVDVSQGEIVVSAPYADRDAQAVDSGAVYIFSEDGSGAWSEPKIVYADDSASGDLFGASVAKVGDDLLVGATRVDIDGVFDAGAAYLFSRQNEQWLQSEKLQASDGPSADERVGRSVDMTEDTMVIGSYNGGEGYVFERTAANEWQQSDIISISDPTKDEGFRQIAITDTMIVNSLDSHDHNGLGSGLAHIFVKDATRDRQAYFSNDTPITLNDGKPNKAAVTTSELTIEDSGTILDIDVRVDIRQFRVSDLSVELVAPDGTTVALFPNLADSGSNFTFTFFDDDADQDITAGSAPFTGSFRPIESLSNFNGLEVNGTWQLRISDNENRSIGELNEWLIVAKYEIPQPSFSIDDVSVTEGDSGTTTAQFTVTRTGDVSATASVDVATADGSATIADNDYVAVQPMTIYFAPGQSQATVDITINGDTIDESDETFVVNLSNASAGTLISDGQGVGTILNDDAQVASTMFVDAINFQSRKGNKEWRAIFEVRDEFGAAVVGASITVTFAGQTYSGQTDGNGQLRTDWLRLSSGSYEAEVTDLVLLDYNWEQTLGWPGDSDDDGLPDRLLTI